jgi:hypothetical protein
MSTGAASEAGAEPPPAVQASYRGIVARAVSEFDTGQIAEARALFLRAHELWPSARTLRTLGMTAFELRMYPRAVEELQAALDDPRRPLPQDQRTQVQTLIEQARGFVGRYRVRLSPRDAELLVDGVPHGVDGIVLSVGEHTLLARAPGYGELRRGLTVQGREDEELALSLEAATPPLARAAATAPPPNGVAESPGAGSPPSGAAARVPAAAKTDEPNRLPMFIAFGAAGAGLVVGAISGIVALENRHDRAAGLPAAHISNVAFICAGAGAAVGTVLLVTAPTSTPSPAHGTSLRTGYALRAVIGLAAIGIDGQF